MPNNFRKPWPGPIDKDQGDLTTYLDDAIDLIDWQWDDPVHATRIAHRCHPWQMGLFAIKVAHGELINGGFSQFLTNSYGELAEEAVCGFRDFELYEFHDLFNEVFSLFPRPISKNRLERIHIFHKRFDIEDRVFQSVEEWNEKEREREGNISTNVFEMAAPILDPFDDRYYNLIKLSKHDRWGRAGLEVPLSDFVDRHKEVFFNLNH